MAPKQKRTESSSNPGAPKKVRYDQQFLEKYEDFPGIKRSSRGSCYAYCIYCDLHFSIAHSGGYDITRHLKKETHQSKAKAAKNTASIASFCRPSGATSAEDDVTKAEAIWTLLLTQWNLPFATADRITQAVKTTFKDSKTAQKFKCSRTKATCLAKEMARDAQEKLVHDLRSKPFSLSTDGSNDQREKLFPLVVTLPDEDGVSTRLLSVPVLTESATGENIYRLIKSELESKNIPITNCLSFGSDSAPVMIGKKSGVLKFLLDDHDSLFSAACPCHLLHHAAERGAAALPFKIDEILVDTFHYLENSSKRLLALEELQKFYDVEHFKILKHVPTRWLSVQRCLERVLENWDALKDFTKKQWSENKPSQQSATARSRLQRIESFYRSDTHKVYCLFLKQALKPFDELNTSLQPETPQVHTLRRRYVKLLNNLFGRFVLPEHRLGKAVLDIKYTERNLQKSDADLMMGEETRALLRDENFRDTRISEIHTHVRDFYEASCAYLIKMLPLQEELLTRAEVVDTELRVNRATTSDLMYFLDRFPCLLPEGVTRDTVEEEFNDYQAWDLGNTKKEQEDKTWAAIAHWKDVAGETPYYNLARVMLGILCLQHSNANCERIFSMVRKNKTDTRASLGKETLDSLLVLKCNTNDAISSTFTPTQLERLRSATYRQLNS